MLKYNIDAEDNEENITYIFFTDDDFDEVALEVTDDSTIKLPGIIYAYDLPRLKKLVDKAVELNWSEA